MNTKYVTTTLKTRQMFTYVKLNWPIISTFYYFDVSRLEIFKTRKSCCLLSKWSFVNWRITSCKPADYKLGVLSFLLKNYCQLLSG